VVVMVPVGARPSGEDYSQALTQAVGGSAAVAANVPAALAQQQDSSGQNADASMVNGPSSASLQAAVQAVFVQDPQGTDAPPGTTNPNGENSNGNSSDTTDKSQTDADKTAKSSKPSHWEPSGLAKIAALYRDTEKLASAQDSGTATGDHLSILG